ncbi:MAG: 2-C-methyl-D-erythritol 4-phosphate cytidylyltransferase [Coriobacteriia bacterium]
MSVVAIIVAGGTGERFGRAGGKQLAPLAGATVITHTIGVFDACPAVDAVVVVARPEAITPLSEATSGSRSVVAIVAGGETRQDSVAAGLAALPDDAETVVVHDGARPLITGETITAALDALGGGVDGCVIGHPAYDTIKRTDADGLVTSTLDRSCLWVAQTPQVFRVDTLRDAHERARDVGFLGTDDASLVERAGGHIRMIAGPRDNIKVTVAADLVIAEAILCARGESL